MMNPQAETLPRTGPTGPAFRGVEFVREEGYSLAFAHLRSAAKPVTVGRALEAYIQWMEAKRYSPWTLHCAKCTFSAFYRESGTGPGTPLLRVTEEIAHRVMKRFATQYTPGTGWRYGTMLLKIFKCFTAGQLFLANPFGKIPQPEKPNLLPLPALSADEVRRLLEIPDLRHNWGIRTRAFLEVLYSTGLRLGECTGLKMGDVDFARGVIRVMGKGAKERLVPVGQQALGWLARYLKEVRPRYARESQDLWVGYTGRAINRICIQRAIREAGKRAGIEKTVTAHTLRRTFATHLLSRGASIRAVQQMLGHGSGESIDRYIRLEPRELRDAHDKTHPRG